MQNWKGRDFKKMLRKNGYKPTRWNGDHEIYENKEKKTISIPRNVVGPMASRLIKEHNLKV